MNSNAYQIKPDFAYTLEECQKLEKQYPNTNSKYPFFCQTHFTAGDEAQFRSVSGLSEEDRSYITFLHLFKNYKKGIFVKIRDGNLDLFLPFSNVKYRNNWSLNVRVGEEYKNLHDFLKTVQTREGREFNPRKVNKYTNSWYANDFLVRWEYPVKENDTGIPVLHDMFKTLCLERKIPDIEFFINKRDFPYIRIDGEEGYTSLFSKTGANQPSATFTPILSMTGHIDYIDLPIPTTDDWSRVCRTGTVPKFFPRTCNRSYTIKKVHWKNKKEKAVFRGSSTGKGVKAETNPRIQAHILGSKYPDLLDTGITGWNCRARVIDGVLSTINPDLYPPVVSPLTPSEQCEYKYILHIPGHACAQRLSLELFYGSCVLIVDSPYYLWFYKELIPWVHFIPIKFDLSDLLEVLAWCKDHDKECREIARKGLLFACTHLSMNGVLNKLEEILVKIYDKDVSKEP